MTYRSTILADLPSHYWPLSEPGGLLVSDVVDPQGTGLSVAASVGFKGIAAGEGAALINNAANNAYLAVRSANYLSVPCSLEIWFYTWSLPATYQQMLMFGAPSSTSDLAIGIWTNGKVYVESRAGAPVSRVFSTATPTNNEWHHVVGAIATTNTDIYLDGVLDSHQPMNWIVPTNQPFGIGGFTDRSQPVNGFVGSPALYSVALGAPAVAAHYAAADQRLDAPVFVGGASAQSIAAMQVDIDRIIRDVERTW